MTWNEALGEPGLSHPNMFAFYIRAALWLDNRSYDEFAEGCGLTLNEVIAVKVGILVPPPWQVLRIADFFGVDRDWFCRLATQARTAQPAKRKAAAAGEKDMAA
jgi:hypothetical protein